MWMHDIEAGRVGLSVTWALDNPLNPVRYLIGSFKQDICNGYETVS